MNSILGFLTRRRDLVSHEWTVELERETDGRVIAEIPAMPGVMTYGASEHEALQKVTALALRVIADRLDSEEVRANHEMTFHLHTRECLASR